MKKALLIAPAPSVHERFNQVNIDALQALSYEVHLAANFKPGGEGTVAVISDQLRRRNAVCRHMPFYRMSLIKNLPALRQLRALLKRERFDLIHAHTETGGLITRLAALFGVPARYIYTPHGMSFYDGCPLNKKLLYYPVEKWICAGMDDVIAVNMEEYALLQRWNKITARYTHGVGADLKLPSMTHTEKARKRAQLGIPDGTLLLLSVGELNKNKNHQTVIRAVSKLNSPDIRYLICGAGPLKSELESLSNTPGVQDSIILSGFRRDISEILQIADVFVHPSYHEGLPVALMEAMASGLPVVCSRIRGNVDLIDDGVSGFLCAPGDPDAFAEAITRLYDASTRERMGRENRERVALFSAGTVRRELKKIYQEAGY